jgi:hypothetical protein
MTQLQDIRHRLKTLEVMIQILKSDDPQLTDLIGRLELLRVKFEFAETESSFELVQALDVEYHTLLNNHRRLQRAYLLRYTKDMRESVLQGLEKFAALAQTRPLSEDEMHRFRRTEDNLRKLDDFEKTHVEKRGTKGDRAV